MDRSFRFRSTVVGTVCGFALLCAGAARAQQPAAGQAPPPQNLQVLPKDISRADLTATMRGFAAALGVQCTYCHVDQPARDMASDAKQTKKTARVMIQMLAKVNETIAAGVGKPAAE